MTAKDDGRPQDSAANPVTVLNDAFRRNPSSGAMVATAGVIGLGAGALPAILEMVRTFDAFTPDNDPYGEHDFGVLEWQDDGVLLRGQADDLDWIARELARLPFDFSVRAPAALRGALGRVARRLERLVRAG